MKNIFVKRIYDPPQKKDGVRILVDRLWPRGIKKETVLINEWAKELAPSTDLRKWFNHDVSKWVEFKKKYLKEIKSNPYIEHFRVSHKKDKNITLLYAAQDEKHNNAVVLQYYLNTIY